MASKNDMDSRVGERRLRPIYDWLDAGNPKKALQEADKVLKKKTDFLCAKALKALALLRLGREDESFKLMKMVREEIPTDDATLQVLNMCYRDLHLPQEVCLMYEAAATKEPSNEDLLVHLFMSYVRIGEYKRQQKTATMLYKLRPKNIYYFWAVMSIVMQSTEAEDKLAKGVVLPLAERMVTKFVEEGKVESEHEVQLYLIILEKQDKLKEVLDVIEGPLGQLLTTYIGAPTKKASLLLELGHWKEGIVLKKSLLRKNPDAWNHYQDYLKAAVNLSQQESVTSTCSDREGLWERADTSGEQCLEFLKMVVEQMSEDGKKVRGPYLAHLELYSKLKEANVNAEAVVGNISDLIVQYFEQFGDRSCCASDLKAYIHLVDESAREELTKRLSALVGLEEGELPDTLKKMLQHISSIQLNRMLGSHEKLSPEEKVRLSTCLLRYFQHGMRFNVDPLPTDFLTNDPYVIVMAHLLLDAWVEKPKDSWLQAAILLLEHALLLSPSNFNFKLLLLRCYHLIGAGDASNKVYQSLDVKHMQLDSMGHLHCGSLLTTGEWRLALTLFEITLRFSSANYKDSVDFLTFAYKFGTFVKIEEFVQFRETLKNSLHYVQTFVERTLLNYLLLCLTTYLLSSNKDRSAALEKIFDTGILKEEPHIYDKLQDNRDLALILNWSPPDRQLTAAMVKSSFEADKLFLRLRMPLLRCLEAVTSLIGENDRQHTHKNNTANHIVSVDEKENGVSALDTLEKAVKQLQERYAEVSKDLPPPVPPNIVSGPLPSRLHGYLATNSVKIQVEVFSLLVASLRNKSEEALSAHADRIISLVHEDVENALSMFSDSQPEKLVKRRELLERLVNAVEMLRLSTFICKICIDLKQPHQKKGKKKQQQQQERDISKSLNDASQSIVLKVQEAITEGNLRLYITLKRASDQNEKERQAESSAENSSGCDNAANQETVLLPSSQGSDAEVMELSVCMAELVLTNNSEKTSNHAKSISVDVAAKIEESYYFSLGSIANLLSYDKSSKTVGNSVI